MKARDQYNQLRPNAQAERNADERCLKRKEDGEEGVVVVVWLEDWIICGLADRQLVCFALEGLERKQCLLLHTTCREVKKGKKKERKKLGSG